MCLPCVLGLALALILASSVGLSAPETVAVGIECCYQNTGLGLTIALSAFPGEAGKAAGVPLVYGVAEILCIGAFAMLSLSRGWTHSPKGEHVCKALAGNYQPAAPEDNKAMALT